MMLLTSLKIQQLVVAVLGAILAAILTQALIQVTPLMKMET